jgi:signal transduction histidine kinase
VSFRTRLLLAFAATTLLSVSLLAIGMRSQLTARLEAQYGRRVDALAQVAKQDLSRENANISARLATLTRSLADDNRFRLAVRGAASERVFLLDWASDAMHVTGLSMLQLQDDEGRILSSGHFRNEFDRLDPALPALLAQSAAQATVVSVRTPGGPLLVLAREDSVIIGDRRLTLVGGIAIDRAFLRRFARESDVALSLVTPDGTVSSDSVPPSGGRSVSGVQPLAYIGARDGARADSMTVAPASVVVTHSSAELDALRRDVNRWFLFALAIAALGAVGLALWMSAGLSRPLAELARATSAIALEGPVLELATRREDEIGTLAHSFGVMGRRLRASAVQLRDAERRATVGEMARQVNHDIKNGLIPIRNVVQHLAQVQEREPGQLATIFEERRATLESSIGYLDTLARNYARLTPKTERRSFDVSAVARDAVRSASADEAVVQAKVAESLPAVVGDPVLLRRILDNLLRNAIESLPSGKGTVTLETRRAPNGSGVWVIVTDTGRGMSEHELAHAFDDFHTTKATGTGLGLSVVRRLTADLQGELRVESTPGRGTTFTIDLPSPSRSAE